MQHLHALIALAFVEVVGCSVVSSTKLARASPGNPYPQDSAGTILDGPADANSVATPEELLQSGVDDGVAQSMQHQLLLQRLHRDEGTEERLRHALEYQQKVLVALQQKQEVLESKERAYEARQARLEHGKKMSLVSRLQSGISRRQHHHNPADAHKKFNSHSVSKSDLKAGMMIDYKQSDKEFWEEKNKDFYGKITFIASYMFQVCLVAVIYKEWIKRSYPLEYKVGESEARAEEFQFGAFDASECCGRDLQICLCATFCSFVRWADTASNPKVGFLEFYPAVFISALLTLVSIITFGTSIPLMMMIFVLVRQRIRRAYNLPSGTFDVLCGDCILWFFCPCCATCQEARQVEYVNAGASYGAYAQTDDYSAMA